MIPEDQDAVVQFHGHFCPGLAIGVRAAELVLREIGPRAADEEVVAIVESDMCGVDAIQFMTGCTFGKGNLIHLDYGKNAFTFIRCSDGKAIRLVLRPQSWGNENDESREMAARTQNVEEGSREDEFSEDLFRKRGQAILALPLEQLFEVQAVESRIPGRARVRESIQCEACGEMVMETRVRLLGGRKLCIPCFEAGERRL